MTWSTPKAGWGIWIAALVLLILIAVLGVDRWFQYKWEHSFWRSYAHYYYCDSIHYNEAQCQAMSNHIPPPPPPPK